MVAGMTVWGRNDGVEGGGMTVWGRNDGMGAGMTVGGLEMLPGRLGDLPTAPSYGSLFIRRAFRRKAKSIGGGGFRLAPE